MEGGGGQNKKRIDEGEKIEEDSLGGTSLRKKRVH